MKHSLKTLLALGAVMSLAPACGLNNAQKGAIIGAQGVARDRVRTAGRGEEEPITTNSTADGRQQNRRIEIAIFAKSE